jgi:hypothetical protein
MEIMLPSVLESIMRQPARPFSEGIAHPFSPTAIRLTTETRLLSVLESIIEVGNLSLKGCVGVSQLRTKLTTEIMLLSVLESIMRQPARPFSEGIAHPFSPTVIRLTTETRLLSVLESIIEVGNLSLKGCVGVKPTVN